MKHGYKYKYKSVLENLHITEEYTASSIKEIHQNLVKQLQLQYIDFDIKQFKDLTSIQKKLAKTQPDDYIIYKVQKTLIKIYKDLNPTKTKVFKN
jgi:hypothetical protein